MTAKDILLYQVGNRAAIERVASSPATFLTGLLLVLITGIPRNYDQLYFMETWRWLYGPLAFSLVSGALIFIMVMESPLDPPEECSSWLGFMGLFWMTAPMAWVYAIPVERVLSSKQAVVANLCLLGLVSIARVWLLSRVLSVVRGGAFIYWLRRVVLAAAMEVLAVSVLGSLTSQRIIASMGGIRNAPEENLLIHVVSVVGNLGFFLALALMILPKFVKLPAKPPGTLPRPRIGLPALGFPLVSLLAWIAISAAPQMEQRRHHHFDQLTRTEGYRAALDFLSTLKPEDLPPHRRLRPSPYEYEAWREYPKCFAAMNGAEPPWVAKYFRDGLDALLQNRSIFNTDGMIACLEDVARIDGNAEWIRARKAGLSNGFGRVFESDAFAGGPSAPRSRLEALGVKLDNPTKPGASASP
jgi:hypothetical protein